MEGKQLCQNPNMSGEKGGRRGGMHIRLLSAEPYWLSVAFIYTSVHITVLPTVTISQPFSEF